MVYRSQHSFGSFFRFCSLLVTLKKHILTLQSHVTSSCFNQSWKIPCTYTVLGYRIFSEHSLGFFCRSLSTGQVFLVCSRDQPRQKDYNYWVFPVVLGTYINICSTTKAPLAKNYLWLKIIHYQNINTDFKEVNLFHRGKNSSSGLSWNAPNTSFCRHILLHILHQLQLDHCNHFAKGVLHVKIKASIFHAFWTDIDFLTVL